MPQTLTLDHVSQRRGCWRSVDRCSKCRKLLTHRKKNFLVEKTLSTVEKRHFEKGLELQESLIKFNKFLQENESKRNRAVKRASDEVKQRMSKEQEVARLQTQLTALQRESDALGAHEPLPHFTRDNRDLSRNQITHEEESESKRLELAAFQKERANEILTFNNRIAALQRALEREELLGVRLQHETDATLRATTQKTLALGQIIMAIGNLLQRCTSGIHGQILKHVEGSYRTQGSTNQSGNDSHDGSGAGGVSTNLSSAPATHAPVARLPVGYWRLMRFITDSVL
ncbi:hypothetical protein PInf_029258 [Phytophthora infestans]|nr:hypothetical protein PInf_029258 [Phytophthora infestans]